METDVNVLGESVKFMILGMGVVFLFLIILVQVVKVQGKFIAKYFPDEEPTVASATSADDESSRVAAVIAAVTEFRKNKS